MLFEELWDRFEQTGSINDYLEYCRWTEAFNITSFVSSENDKTESGDIGGFAANGDGISA